MQYYSIGESENYIYNTMDYIIAILAFSELYARD